MMAKKWDPPLESELSRLDTATPMQTELEKKPKSTETTPTLKKIPMDEDDESLKL